MGYIRASCVLLATVTCQLGHSDGLELAINGPFTSRYRLPVTSQYAGAHGVSLQPTATRLLTQSPHHCRERGFRSHVVMLSSSGY
jgi:hypothetical protein